MEIEGGHVAERLATCCVLLVEVAIELDEGRDVLEDPKVRPVVDER